MGYQTIIIVLLSSTLLSVTILGLSGVWDQSTNTVVSQANEEQAVNVASSGINLAISTLRRNKQWRAGFSNLPVSGGTCNVSLTELAVDSIRIQSQGIINGTTHNSIAVVKLQSIFPSVEAALTVFGDSVHWYNAGKSFLIDGNDYNADGTPGGKSPAVLGMGVTSSKVEESVANQLTAASVPDLVQGSKGTPSVGVFTNSNLFALRDLYKSLYTIKLAAGKYSGNITYGTLSKPEIVWVAGDLEWDGSITGAGILVVDGDLKMKGGVNWKGITIAVSGDLTFDIGVSGTPNLWGTTWVGSESASKITNIHVNGTPEIKYSAAMIEQVLQNLDLLAVEIVNWYE